MVREVRIRTRRRPGLQSQKYPVAPIPAGGERMQEGRLDYDAKIQLREHRKNVAYNNRLLHQAQRQSRGIPDDVPMYNIGETVRTLGNTHGKIIGNAQYVWGWEYRIEPDDAKPDPRSGKKRTIYREEWQIYKNPIGSVPKHVEVGSGQSGLVDTGSPGLNLSGGKEESIIGSTSKEGLGPGLTGPRLPGRSVDRDN